MKAGDLRPGMAVSMDGRLCVVVKVEHRTPGNLRAFVQAKFKDVISAQHTEKRLNPAESVEATTLDRRGCEFLYQDGTGYIFMDSRSFDQFTLDEDTVGDAAGYLPPNAHCDVLVHDERPILLELPTTVDLLVAECQPGIKGATATNQLKEAVMETGLRTRVPPFIEAGERLRIATADGSYVSRAKED